MLSLNGLLKPTWLTEGPSSRCGELKPDRKKTSKMLMLEKQRRGNYAILNDI